MTYTDYETGKEYEKGPTDFLTDGNVKGEWKGEVWHENHNFDQDLWDKEWAEWEAYKADVDSGDNDNRDKDVEGYFDSNEHEGEGDDGPPDESDHTFTDPDLKPPPVPGGTENPGKGVTAVSTEAITTFANNIEKLYGPIDDLIKDLEAAKVAPGALPASFKLTSKVIADETGLVPGTVKFANKMRDTLGMVVTSARALASNYTNAEEFNKMTGKDLGEFVADLKGSINKLGGADSPGQ